MQELKGKELNAREVIHARHFVYNVYAQELNWLPAADNPSHWKVKKDEQGSYFSDIYDVASVWFGVFAGQELAAAGRIVEPLDNKLEVELYQEIPDFIKNEQIKRIEINRLAVKKRYSSSPALIILLQTMFQYILDNSIDFVVSGVPEATIDFALLIGLKDFNPPMHFFYSKADTAGATVMYCDCRKKQEVRMQMKKLNMEVIKTFNFFVDDV